MKTIEVALSQVATLLKRGEPTIYIDYPVYANIGDLLIQEGAERFFQLQGIVPERRYSLHIFFRRNLPKFPAGHTLVFQGGGNFGDLHHPFQALRERIIENHHSHKIVILPQTIHYTAEDTLQRSSKILRGHPDLHIFCRDLKSHQLALNHFSSHAYLAPDMAHFLHPVSRTAACENKKLLLLRRDFEAAPAQSDSSGTATSVDWDDLVPKSDCLLIRSFAVLHKLAAYCQVSPSLYRPWRRVQQRAIGHMVAEFSRYSHVTSSRLHAHILSTLMGIPNTLIDNSYGKNSSYFEAWTHCIPTSSMSKLNAS